MDITNANQRPWAYRRRSRLRVRPYVLDAVNRDPVAPAPAPALAPTPALLSRVLDGLRALPDRPPQQPAQQPAPSAQANKPREPYRSPLVRLIDAQRARTVADRTPTVELPVVTPTMAQGVSWR